MKSLTTVAPTNRLAHGFTAVVVFGLVASFQPANAVTIEMVTVGNPGNAPDTRYHGFSVGSVNEVYQIGKYEVTAGQYTEFLNAVARADPNRLYNTTMYDLGWGPFIRRTGSLNNWSYSVAADWADRPVNLVSFWDAVRFANWMHNGQPTGPQGPGTTEGGAYHDVGNATLFGRNAGAKFFIPSEDEWYKAAYHDKSAGLAATYFDYPTGSNTRPLNTLPDPGNHANFLDLDYSIGGPYYRTQGGEYANSPSPYGTFDQGGNVGEVNEALVSRGWGGVRGGAWEGGFEGLQASIIGFADLAAEFPNLGFRVASPADLPGDFNGAGSVDAADYVVWHKSGGTQAGYDTWRANFGRTSGAGSGSALPSAEPSSAAVPEPSSAAPVAMVVLILVLQRTSPPSLFLRLRP
jgi:formylglycine-generating enzyme required for sulfatase activity